MRRFAWLRAVGRAAVLRAPRWEGLNRAGPRLVALLVLAAYALGIAVERLFIDGGASFSWHGLLAGWFELAVCGFLAWSAARAGRHRAGPPAGTLFALGVATSLAISVAVDLVYLPVHERIDRASGAVRWAAWLLPMAWLCLARIVLLWRASGPSPVRLAVLVLAPATVAVSHWLQPAQFWTPVADPEAFRGLAITEPALEAQGHLLPDALAALTPPRPGRIEVYGATYAPYASQDVFLRESAVVAKTMGARFDAHMVQLVLNNASSTTLPWATPSNLRRTIEGIARVMDREHDVLFLHLTSHGGYDGRLATESWPLQTDPVTPQQLRAWLDDAGIRWRVLSISACYSGSWIAPLAGEGTLVMTAADATHTSYGCGSRSPLTFFGQAMYVDALNETPSFAEAHAKARKLIDQREKAAGKTDGYSNPQISEGAGIREVLEQLAAQQDR